MKVLFDRVSQKTSKAVTHAYSTSFSLGISFLSRKFHEPIYGIYGFVRLADEIVDSFQGYNQQSLMEELRVELQLALSRKISLNPILNSFQDVVWKYDIEFELIDTFLKSMEMDLSLQACDRNSYDDYILGSAEMVGLMCLRVFTEGDKNLYNELKPYAQKLGSAFQKVNFLRDVQTDYVELGRTYFPEVDMEKFSLADKQNIEAEIAQEFQEALIGIQKLPISSRKGVYLAYFYYLKLFHKIKQVPSESVLQQRIRIPNWQKMGLMVQSLARHQLNIL